jgi:hypothetical protein
MGGPQQFALESSLLELISQHLLRGSLVPRRVDRVQPDQALEQGGRVVSEGHRGLGTIMK